MRLDHQRPLPAHVSKHRTALSWFAGLGYLTTVVASNRLADVVGLVPVGFGLHGLASVYVVGLVLLSRDLLQWLAGRRAALLSLTAASGLSYLVASPAVATASVAAFTISELSEFAAFTALAPRWATAVALSGLLGLTLDSAVFLLLTGTPLSYLPGQIVGKAYSVLGAAVVIALRRRNL